MDIFNILTEIPIFEQQESEKIKKLTPFDFVNILFTKKNIPNEQIIKEQYDQFMVNRIICCIKDFKTKKLNFVLMVSSLNDKKLSNLEHFYCLFYKLPQIQKVYPSYLWNQKDDVIIDKNKLIDALKWKYNYNTLGAEYAIRVIQDEEKQQILTEFTKRMQFLGKKI